MNQFACAVVFGTALGIITPRVARGAEPDRSPTASLPLNPEPAARERNPWDRVLSVSFQSGLGAPLGFGGVAVEGTPLRWLTFGAGVGASSNGPQTAFMGRLRIPFSNGTAVAFGAGISMGHYEASPFLEFDYSTKWTWRNAVWKNVELSVEHRWSNGVEIRGFFGAAFLDGAADSCSARDEEAGRQETCSSMTPSGSFLVTSLPYLGMSVGYAFDL